MEKVVASVPFFHEEGPVRHGHGVHQQLGALHHFIGGGGGAVSGHQLLHGGPVHVGVAAAQDIGSIGAHEVQVGVPIQVPEIGALGLGGQERPLLQGGRNRPSEGPKWP